MNNPTPKEEIAGLVKTAKGVAAREMAVRICKKVGADVWKAADIAGILGTYLQEVEEEIL